MHVPWGSLLPTGTFVQVPAVLAETLHDLHVPLQFVEQQTPCVQKPDLHSLAPLQVCPLPLRPHEPLTQVFGGSQSALVVHAALQIALPHR